MRDVRRLPGLSLVVVAGLVLAACSDDDSGGSSGSTTTSSTTSSTAVSGGAVHDEPEAAAQCAFDAWVSGDEAGAQGCADDIAIDELFSQSGADARSTMTSQGCFDVDEQKRCAWTYEGGSMAMILVESEAAGWRVSDVEYIAD
jgi:hypothetical protein